jgi:hypothetical protein
MNKVITDEMENNGKNAEYIYIYIYNEEVLLRVSEHRNILHEIRKRKGNLIGHILRRNCVLKEVIERKIKGRIEVTSRGGRRRKMLLDDLGGRRGYSNLKEEALDFLKASVSFLSQM